MLHRLPNGKIAAETQDTFDGDIVKPLSIAEDWTDGTYHPEKSLAVQRKNEQIARDRAAKLAKLKRDQEFALAKKLALESNVNNMLMRKEQMQGPSNTQKVLAAYHLRNQAMGETKSDYGPTYDLEQMSAKSVYNVTKVEGQNYGPKEYFVQDYDYQNNPNYQTFKNRYADNVQFEAPVGMVAKDNVDLYVEGNALDKMDQDFAEAAKFQQAQSEFNYTEEDMVKDLEAKAADQKKGNAALMALVAAALYYFIGG